MKRALKGQSKAPARQLQTAKDRFSEVFRRAHAEGPQYVTKAGKETAVIVPAEQFEQLIARRRQPRSLVEFFRSSPLVGMDLDLTRDRDPGRDVKL